MKEVNVRRKSHESIKQSGCRQRHKSHRRNDSRKWFAQLVVSARFFINFSKQRHFIQIIPFAFDIYLSLILMRFKLVISFIFISSPSRNDAFNRWMNGWEIGKEDDFDEEDEENDLSSYIYLIQPIKSSISSIAYFNKSQRKKK